MTQPAKMTTDQIIGELRLAGGRDFNVSGYETGENESITGIINAAADRLDQAATALTEAASRIKELEDGLGDLSGYAQHDNDCAANLNEPCDCGYSDASRRARDTLSKLKEGANKPTSDHLVIVIPRDDSGLEVSVDAFNDSGAAQDAVLAARTKPWVADALSIYRHPLKAGAMGEWWCGLWTGYSRRQAPPPGGED